MVDNTTEMVVNSAVMVTDTKVEESNPTETGTPLARLMAGRKIVWVAEQLGIDRHRLRGLMAGTTELRASEAVKAAELFGVEVRELLP